jgi:hypothetical protein
LSFMSRCSCRRTSAEACEDHSGHVIRRGNDEDDDQPTLTGKIALVTGASRGMGRASALALAAAGAQVLLDYGRGANEADGVVAEMRKAGGRADAIATDLAAADDANKLARQARGGVGDRSSEVCRRKRALAFAARSFIGT